MTHIILVAHGHFASGILSSLELIAGKQNQISAIDFVEGMTSLEVHNHLSHLLTAENKALVLCDLLGGTPFKVASTLMEKNPHIQMNVLSGLNLTMLIESVFARQNNLSLDEMVSKILASSKDGIVDWKSIATEPAEVVFEEGGI